MRQHLQFLTEGEFERALRRVTPNVRDNPRGARRSGRRSLQQDFFLRDEHGWGPIRLESTDISPTGVFLASDLFFESGSSFWLEFKSPRSGKLIRVWSRVARVDADGFSSNARRPGMAFEFLDMSGEDWDELSTYTHRL
jgi:hypothetical protein